MREIIKQSNKRAASQKLLEIAWVIYSVCIMKAFYRWDDWVREAILERVAMTEAEMSKLLI